MNQDRRDKQNEPTRSSNMEPAEGSRETVQDSGSNNSSPKDLGSSTDRAMFTDRRSAESRSPGEGGVGSSADRGMGSSSGRSANSGMSSGTDDSGGISNRELSREESEQEQLPDRGRRKSDQ